MLVVCDSDFGAAAHDPEAVERLRRAKLLVVFGWADTPLAQAADLALPVATHAEKDGTFVNVEWRLQRFRRPSRRRAWCARGPRCWPTCSPASTPRGRTSRRRQVFDRLAAEVPAFAGLAFDRLPATGVELAVPGAGTRADS